MVANRRPKLPPVRELTIEEGWELLEEETRRLFQMSAREFIDAWFSGAFGDVDDNPDALETAMDLAFVGLNWRGPGPNTQGS